MGLNVKYEAQGSFQKLKDERITKGIQEIVSAYHYRNGKRNNDGSRGTIRISPKEFRDLLAYMSGVDEPQEVQNPIGEKHEEIDCSN